MTRRPSDAYLYDFLYHNNNININIYIYLYLYLYLYTRSYCIILCNRKLCGQF